MARLGTICLLVLALSGLIACGGGGGGGGGGSSNASRTTFTGNLSATTTAAARGATGVHAALAIVEELVAATHANAADVTVCVENTTFCTLVNADGVFTLAADVGGDVTLVFTGPDFVARVTLTAVPLGATVRLTNIRCSTVTGTCEPEDLEIEGVAARGPIRCEQGPIHITEVGDLIIHGGGDDCIRTAGQCEVSIDADHIVLDGCDDCVNAAGGSDVTLSGGAGGVECHASGDGLHAAGNAAVHVTTSAGGDVTIDAGGVGVLSEGTALVEIAGDRCSIAGDEGALQTHGNADITTGDCATIDLVGGTNDDDGNDDEGDNDDDHGNGNGVGNGNGNGNGKGKHH